MKKLCFDNNKLSIIDSIGITILGLFSFLYCVFEINFAELNVQLPFLNFPIFIGEIVLAICVSLLIARWIACRQKLNRKHYMLFLYMGFVLLKALNGYLTWGPLALRHSALFYYPLFALCGYTFFRQEYFKNKQNIIIISALLFISIFWTVNTRYKFICFVLALLLIRLYPKRFIKYLLLFPFIIFTPYKVFLGSMRAMWLSNVISIIFIIATLIIILKLRGSLKIALGVPFLFFLCLSFITILNKSGLQTIIDVKENIIRFRGAVNYILNVEKNFIMYDMGYARLYNKGYYMDESLTEKDIRVRQFRNKISAQQNLLLTDFYKKQAERTQLSPMQKQVGGLKSTLSFQQPSSFLVGVQGAAPKNILQKDFLDLYLARSYVTNLFRIFIWKDALESLMRVKPLFGFDFGKPFRSKSTEILNAGYAEWSRDGWIAMHNSYLEILYRSGMVGIIFIISIFAFLLKMIRISISSKSVNGLLLCGALINWLIAANFMIIFELPYSAIPFWSLFGITFSYLSPNIITGPQRWR